MTSIYPKSASRFAMIQMNSQSAIYPNLIAIEYATRQAVSNGADCVIVPENAFSFGNHKVASQHFDSLKDWCGQLARQHNIYFIAGTLPCPFRPDGTPVPDNKFRQSSLLFDPAGDCIARYDKIHLFKASVTDNTGKITEYDEGKTFEAGNVPVVANTALGKIGMMVCFDLRFPQLAKYLRQQDADILTAPSAFTYDTGKLHWQTLLQARALDAQCLLIGLGQAGTHYLPNGTIRKTWGHSQFIDGNGQIMPMTTLDTNPFLVEQASIPPKSAKQCLDGRIKPNIATPLAQQAVSWLNADKNALDLSHLPQSVTLHLTDFEPNAQTQFRQHIDLANSERFGIIAPTD